MSTKPRGKAIPRSSRYEKFWGIENRVLITLVTAYLEIIWTTLLYACKQANIQLLYGQGAGEDG